MEFVAPNALHDSGHVVDPPKCHPGTRIAILQTIMDWIAGSNEVNQEKLITWLSGAAGAGKSAIGRTVCEVCEKEGTLLASFFFGSNDSTRNHPRSLVATIAYQICCISPIIREVVSAFIDYDPLIFTRSLRTQLQSLVIEPLSVNYANEVHKVPPLIVLDALDECIDEASQRDILDAILHTVTSSSIPIRVLVCSRPESNITNFFSSAKINATLFKIFLGDLYEPDADIKLFLCEKLEAIREGHIFKSSIPPSWPDDDHIEQIVKKSSGQFIYTATVVRYVESPRHRPQQRLAAILGLRPPFEDLPFAELDALYTHILIGTGNLSITTNIMVLLALYEEIIPSDIDRLLGLEVGEAEVVLCDLGAIVGQKHYVGGPTAAILLHKSFGDFLFDSHRSKDFSKSRAEARVHHATRLIEIYSG